MAAAAVGHLADAAAIILSGGQSRRMGTDKASLVVDGVTMLERVRALLDEAGVMTVVVAGPDDVPDPHSGEADFEPQGPLAGIVSAWVHLRSRRPDPIVVLACDLPSLTAAVVHKLVETSGHHAHGALAHDGERPQPLIAAYRPQALDALERAYAQGERSVRRSFAEWDLGVVTFESGELADADTPEDLDGFVVQWPSG